MLPVAVWQKSSDVGNFFKFFISWHSV